MALGPELIAIAHELQLLIVGRLLQGVGVGLLSGAIFASLFDSYRNRLSAGRLVQSLATILRVHRCVDGCPRFQRRRRPSRRLFSVAPFVTATLALTPITRGAHER
jgi:hypothetical protein